MFHTLHSSHSLVRVDVPLGPRGIWSPRGRCSSAWCMVRTQERWRWRKKCGQGRVGCRVARMIGFDGGSLPCLWPEVCSPKCDAPLTPIKQCPQLVGLVRWPHFPHRRPRPLRGPLARRPGLIPALHYCQVSDGCCAVELDKVKSILPPRSPPNLYPPVLRPSKLQPPYPKGARDAWSPPPPPPP